MLDLYAGGMSVRDIAEHLRRLYGVQVGRDTISRGTDAVLEDIAAWRSRPLEAVYPIVYFDPLHAKMTEDRSLRTRACYTACVKLGVTVTSFDQNHDYGTGALISPDNGAGGSCALISPDNGVGGSCGN